MDQTKIPAFDDLLFKSRNKDYGAYQLRKRYNSVLSAGIIVGSLVFGSIVIVPFANRPSSDQKLFGNNKYVQIQTNNLEFPEEMFSVPPSPTLPKLRNIQEIPKYVAPEILDTIIPAENDLATPDEILSVSDYNFTSLEHSGDSDDSLLGMTGLESDGAFSMVEVMPSFKGGNEQKFREWVQRSAYYPQEESDRKIKGTVFITFIIEKDGSISNVSLVKGVDPLLDNEAIKVISESPRWSPGLQRGQPVRVRFLISLAFSPQ